MGASIPHCKSPAGAVAPSLFGLDLYNKVLQIASGIKLLMALHGAAGSDWQLLSAVGLRARRLHMILEQLQ